MCMCVCVHICVHLHIYLYIFYVYIHICAKYSDFLCNLIEKMCLFYRENRYKIHSGSGLAGSGSEMIYSGSDSGSRSGKKFRIRPDPDPQHCKREHPALQNIIFLNFFVFWILLFFPSVFLPISFFSYDFVKFST
jgi:hypothetical protein